MFNSCRPVAIDGECGDAVRAWVHGEHGVPVVGQGDGALRGEAGAGAEAARGDAARGRQRAVGGAVVDDELVAGRGIRDRVRVAGGRGPVGGRGAGHDESATTARRERTRRFMC